MTKVKIVALVEEDGKEVVRTDPQFLIGFKEKLSKSELAQVAQSVLDDIAAHLQAGIRRNAPGKGVKIWPLEG